MSSTTRSTPTRPARVCAHCGHDLTGIPAAAVCPECGRRSPSSGERHADHAASTSTSASDIRAELRALNFRVAESNRHLEAIAGSRLVRSPSTCVAWGVVMALLLLVIASGLLLVGLTLLGLLAPLM